MSVADEREGELGAVGRAPDRVVIDATVAQLRELDRRSGLERMVAIGKLVLDQFFAGSAEAWRERRRNKNNSVRRIAQHPECPLRHSSLNQALGVYVVVRALPCVQTFAHVGACHVIAVLHLVVDAQEAWLRKAEQERWTVRELKAAVLESRRLRGERRGRPRASEGHAYLARVRRHVRDLEAALHDYEALPLGVDEHAQLGALMTALKAVLAQLPSGSMSPSKTNLAIEQAGGVSKPLLRMVGS